MTISKVRQVQADMAQDLIENYIPDLTMPHALTVLAKLEKQFGLALICWTRLDVEGLIAYAREGADLPALSEEEMEIHVARLCEQHTYDNLTFHGEVNDRIREQITEDYWWLLEDDDELN